MKKSTLQKLIWLFLLLLCPWFFLGGPEYYSSRVFKETWNLGHVLFFGLVAFELECILRPRLKHGLLRFFLCLLLVLLGASCVELLQNLLPGRIVSIYDILYSVAGACIVLFFRQGAVSGKVVQTVMIAASAALLALLLTPLSRILYDEYRSWRDFPVLADFESAGDVTRWTGSNAFTRAREPVWAGGYSLLVKLAPGRYSGITLRHFPENWKGARALHFSVYNPGEPITLHFRIHDARHQHGEQKYSDRFNGRQQLERGWNLVRISLEDIEHAPEGRLMDLDQIRQLGLFLVENRQERVLYLDEVRLEFEEPAKKSSLP